MTAQTPPPRAADSARMKSALPELTDEQLDADGDGSVTPEDIRALTNRGVPASSIEAALEKMQAQLGAMQAQLGAVQTKQGAMQAKQDAMQAKLDNGCCAIM